MDQHQEAFIEEAKEILVRLEEGLLALEEDPGDDEVINAVFRALHTIKGSGGMFGFENIEHFTHDLENAFEMVRSGDASVSHELIDLTLAARDEIQYLVNIAIDEVPDEREESRTAILQQLQTLIATPSSEEAPELDSPAEEQAADAAGTETFLIHFRPEHEAFAHGSDPLILLAELRDLGKLDITPLVENIPPIESIDPESCYIGWDLSLETDAGENAVRDVFIFVGDDCELDIKKAEASSDDSESEEAISETETPLEESSPEETSTVTEKKHPKKKPAEEKAASGKKAQPASTVRVPSERLDSMVNLVGELVIAQARLSRLGAEINNVEIAAVAEEIERLSSDMRDTTMSMRMIQIGSVFGKYKRIVRDLSRDLGKEVELVTKGGETELDKTVIERLHDPMVHMIRNAIDHGVEMPAEREAAGKSAAGRIQLTATHSGAYVLISVMDDGAGLDRDRILEKAIERGLTTSEAELSDREIFDFILHPGFSTKQKISELSGRGVGMDVVARNIRQLGGRIQIESVFGEGSTMTLRLPLTLAIIDGLQIQCGDADYVLPVGAIEECVEMTEKQVASDRYRHVLNLRDEMVPYISLRDLFDVETERPLHEKIIVINDDGNRFGIVVDVVVGELQAVIKPLGKLCRDIGEVSGATILGDGTVALILDISRIFDVVQDQEDTKKTQ
jgi:two-component system, chemotaxis family, sensor kinase CheA